MEETHVHVKGDWIVHSQFGTGQIAGVDVKEISGEKTQYYKIKTNNSTFWVPVDQMDSEMLRPLSTPEEIEQAIATLQKPPKKMSSNYKLRQLRIQKAQIRNTPKAIARIIRDLRAFKRDKGALNRTERSAFRAFKQQLVEEWAIVTDTKNENVAVQLDNLLDPNQVSSDG